VAPSAGGLVRGKVSRELLEIVFGSSLLATVHAAFEQEQSLFAQVDRLARRMSRREAGGDGAGGSGDGAGRGDLYDEKDRNGENEDGDLLLAEQLVGGDEVPGTLQV